MDSELKERWVKALRSKDYPQIQGNLRTTEGYCCMGVLADLIYSEWGCLNEEGVFVHKLTGRSGRLPDYMVHNLGDFDQQLLIILNDSGKSFDEIADYIEGNL